MVLRLEVVLSVLAGSASDSSCIASPPTPSDSAFAVCTCKPLIVGSTSRKPTFLTSFLFHVSREFTRIFFNLTTDFGQQTSDCLKDEIKNPHQYVRFVESLLRILRLCERVLRADSRDTWRNLRDLQRRFGVFIITLRISPVIDNGIISS